jgi:hypothetical protein
LASFRSIYQTCYSGISKRIQTIGFLTLPFTLFAQIAEAKEKEPTMWDNAKTFFDNMEKFFKWYAGIFEWLKHLPTHILDGSIQLLSWLYELVADFMLGVPTELFSSNWFNTASYVFAGIGFLTTLILPKLEGLRQIVLPFSRKQSSTFMDWKTLLRRLPVAVIGAGLAPKAFEMVFTLLDKFTSTIIHAGRDQIMMATTHVDITNFGWLDGLAIIGFDIAFLVKMYPLFLQLASRYFNLLSLGALTPLALSAWVYDEHRGWYEEWLDSLKAIILSMIWYAFFLTIMGVLIVGIGGVTTFKGLFIKLLIIIGCINTMTNPPHILRKYTDSGKDVSDMLKQFKDTITLQNVRQSKSYKFVKKQATSETTKKSVFEGYVLWQIIKNKFKK